MNSTNYREDLTGLKFNRLIVIKFHGRLPRRSKPTETLPYWECLCDCGQTSLVEEYKLKKGKTQSCGCLRKERATLATTKHGSHKTSEYFSWNSMIQRCTNPNNSKYDYYGKLGIKVCERWSNSFENFLEDMGKKPDKEYSIDRICGNGDYEPSNCRWADKSTQSYNRDIQSNNKSGIKGVCQDSRSGKWVAQLSFKGKKFRSEWENKEDAILARLNMEKEVIIV